MTIPAPRLDPRFSLYLDAVRFIADVLVVLTHLIHFIQYGVVKGRFPDAYQTWVAKP